MCNGRAKHATRTAIPARPWPLPARRARGLLLALPDPACGVAQDLNALIKYKLARFMARDERELGAYHVCDDCYGIREACTRQELDRRRIEADLADVL